MEDPVHFIDYVFITYSRLRLNETTRRTEVVMHVRFASPADK